MIASVGIVERNSVEKSRFDLWCDAAQAFSLSLATRLEDHDVQIMNLYWKECASLFQGAGMSRLVC